MAEDEADMEHELQALVQQRPSNLLRALQELAARYAKARARARARVRVASYAQRLVASRELHAAAAADTAAADPAAAA